MPRSSRLALVASLALLAACLEARPFAPKIEEVNFAPELGVDLANSTKTASGLYYRDITTGAGAQVRTEHGDTVFVRYTGWLRNGVQFDSNVSAPSPLTFVTGTLAVIQGFDEGVRGMRVGGQRQIIIPPALGYGNQRVGSIPPNSILVFTISLTGANLGSSTP